MSYRVVFHRRFSISQYRDVSRPGRAALHPFLSGGFHNERPTLLYVCRLRPRAARRADVRAAAGAGQPRLKHGEQFNEKERGGPGKAVRASTERFKNVAAAERENYHLMFGCVSGPD